MEEKPMTSIDRIVKKHTDATERQLKAVEDWFQMYGHHYPNLAKASDNPAKTIVSLMDSHRCRVDDAAIAAETFAQEWLDQQGDDDESEESSSTEEDIKE